MFRPIPFQDDCRCIVKASLSLALMITFVLLVMAPGTSAQYQLKKPVTSQSEASITVTSPSGDTNWEKGKRYEITWTSTGLRGSVKIDLIDQTGNATSLVRMTRNSGKYSFSLKRSVSDGDYKIRVSTTDGKTVGEGTGMVSISSRTAGKSIPKPGAGETKSSPSTRSFQPKTAPPVSPATKSALQPDADQPTGLTVGSSEGVSPGELSEAEVVRREISAVPATDLQIAYIESAVSASELQSLPGVSNLRPTHMGGVINVTSPAHDAEWLAGSQYLIEWTSANLSGDVKIDLVRVPSPTDEEVYPVVAGTENDGAFDYQVPYRMGCKPWWFHVRVASLDGQTEDFSPNLSIYTEPVDMTCRIVDMKQRSDSKCYVFYIDRDEWLEFDVCLRNNGTQPSVTVQTVSVVLIKEPEEIVVVQEEWGFSNIYPRLWYMTPEPRKFAISDEWADAIFRHGGSVNMEDGAYRVEVTVDPFNQLGEDPALRADNKRVIRFEIR